MKEILITSSVLIVALLVLRLIFAKKVSRRLIYGAWILVALRLLIPIQIGELDFSVLTATREVTQTIEQVATRPVSGPSQQEVYKDIIVDYVEKDQSAFAPQVQEQIRQETANGTATKEEIADKIQQKYPQQEIFAPQVQQQVQQQVAETVTAPTLGQIANAVWLAGVAVMAVWFTVLNLRNGALLRKTSEKLECESPIPVYISEKIPSPCLVGLFNPAVYLTPASAVNEESRRHVLTHELTHYTHRDHIWALVRCLCLCVYWFNPLIWAAAWVSRRDCELACDEGALKRLGEAERIAYGKTLLEVVGHAANPSNLLQTATAMAETKKQLKERVNFIVRKPKISLIAVICMVLICAIIAGCVAAGPASVQNNPPATTPMTTPPNTTAPTTTQPDQNVAEVKTLVSNMRFRTVKVADESIASQFETELDLTITEYIDGSISLGLAFEMTDDLWYDFAYSDNYFTVQHEELGLPYYCAKAYIFQPGLDGYMPFDFAVDIEKGYMIFKESSNRNAYYVVASSDPAVDPLQIAEHFSTFFRIYDHTDIDTGIRTDLYFDLYGTWISEDGEILGTMPFYINGKLPEEYEDGSAVEMELNFIWPESSGYRNEGAMTYTGTVNVFEEHHGHPNFHGTGTLCDSETNEQIPFAYNIFPMDSTVIIYVNGQYLIGVPREMSQMDSTLNYYKEFIFNEPSQPQQPLPSTPAEELAKFNALFGDRKSWYNMALTSEYTMPAQINLEYLFYNGFADEPRKPTDSELAELKAVIENKDFAASIENYEIFRLPVEKMNQVLTEVFGITLEDVDDTGFDDMYYLKSTNCYYLIHTDALWTEGFNALSVEYMEDGSIRVYYTADWESTVRCVTLMPHGDGYRILSNIAVE